MTRSVGGVDRLERAECDTAVGGPVTGTDGTGEATAYSSASGTVGIGLAGAGGTPGVSQPHRTHGQPADAGTASSPQQDTCAAAQVEVGEQQDRFPPGGQHDFAVGVKGAARSWDGTAGVRADVAQLQARAGAAVPIAVETASSRQTNGRTRLKIGMRASYTRPLARVNPIRPPVGQGVWQIFLASLRTYPINFKTAVPGLCPTNAPPRPSIRTYGDSRGHG